MEGLRHVTTECDHCYAETFIVNRQGKDFGSITRTKTWGDPVKFNADARPNGHWFRPKGTREKIFVDLGRRPRIFCASWTDFFIQDADAWRPEAWDLIRKCTNLDWLILTKRTKLAATRLPEDWGTGWPHVWLGTTCGAKESYYRVDELRALPAAVRFISAEPLLESLSDLNLDNINWLIAGGESGVSKADGGPRVMKDAWAIELRDKCKAEGWAFSSSSIQPSSLHKSPHFAVRNTTSRPWCRSKPLARTPERGDEEGDLAISPGGQDGLADF